MVTLVIVAYPDSAVIGAGGTIARLVAEKEKVILIPFSYGQGADPLKDPEILTKKLAIETSNIAKLLGIKGVNFLKRGNVQKAAEDKQIVRKIRTLIRTYAPKLIITHTINDLHPENRAVSGAVMHALKTFKRQPKVYAFTMARFVQVRHRHLPRIYMNISEQFPRKLDALKMFRSQPEHISNFYLAAVKTQNWLAGFRAGYKYAESFYIW